MKPNKHFKMEKTTKRLMLDMPRALRRQYKRMMIDAQLCEQEAGKKKIKEEGVEE